MQVRPFWKQTSEISLYQIMAQKRFRKLTIFTARKYVRDGRKKTLYAINS